MKNFSAVFSLLFLFTLSTQITSCVKDPCSNVTCSNGGNCHDGKCTCPLFYEGTNCTVEWRTKWLGDYNGTLTGGGQSDPATLTIANGSSVEKLNFLGLIGDLRAEVSTSGSIGIPTQTVYDSGIAYTFVGSGAISGNHITLTILLTAGGSTTSFTYDGYK